MYNENEDHRTSYPSGKGNISELVDLDPLTDVRHLLFYIMHVSLFETIANI